MASHWCCFADSSFGLNSIVRLRLGRWKTVPTAGIDVFVGFPGHGMSPFIVLVNWCTVRRVVMLLQFGADGEHRGWELDWSAGSLDVRHRVSHRQLGLSPKCRAACLHMRGH